MEFISESRPPLLMQSTSTVPSSCISEGNKDLFCNHDQLLEVILLFPPKSRGIGYPGCSCFSRAEDSKAE